MKRIVVTFVALLALPAAAFALGEEAFGNAPRVRQPEWADGVIEVVNLKSRVYLRWVNGNEDFFYRGDAAALNEALKRFAAIKDDAKQIVLLPGTGKTHSFQHKEVPFDWRLHVPSGIYKAMTKRTHPVLTVYVNAARVEPVDRKLVERWLPGLNDESFKVRQQAEQELEKLGRGAKPWLRAALPSTSTAEGRKRIEAVLQKLGAIDVGDLDVPKGVPVITVDDLLAAYTKETKDDDKTICGMALLDLSTLAPYSEKVVPTLAEMTRKGKHEYIRRCAAGALGHLGAAAKSVVPTLKESLEDAEANVRGSIQAALDQIDAAKEDATRAERIKSELEILKDIREYKKSLGGK